MRIAVAGDAGTKTRYAPPADQPGAHGDGWWLAEIIWSSKRTDGTNESDQHVKFSSVVRLST
jgi:hypothetical protein